jgi:putative nucleotidyltransferase with HDIG domain
MAAAQVGPAERAEALAVLPPNLRALFLRMGARDQAHALRVLRRLVGQGEERELLLQAALLHDVGKVAAGLGIPGRSLVVLAGALRATALLRRLPVVGGRATRYLDHPALGAGMLAAAGGSEGLVRLVAEHQAVMPKMAETLVLQAADGRE